MKNSMKKLIGLSLLITGFFFNPALQAEESSTAATEVADDLIAGVNYEMVTPAQATESGDKIEVVEVFFYGCGHCYQFEPTLNKWLETKADDVEFRRMPGIFSRGWVPHAKAFYAAEKLGILEVIHEPLFEAIHRDNIQIKTDDDVIDFVTSLDGVDKKEFEKAFRSYTVKTKIKQAMQMSRAYGVKGVPSMVVNGKYWSSGSVAGTYPELIRVVNGLIEKERK